MKTLTLLIGNETKDFTIPFVSGLVWRKFIEIKANFENPKNLTLADLDALANLAVFAFRDQFTLEQFYDGIPHDAVMRTIDGLFAPTNDSETEGNGKK